MSETNGAGSENPPAENEALLTKRVNSVNVCVTDTEEHIPTSSSRHSETAAPAQQVEIPVQVRRNSSASCASEVICRICHGPQTPESALIVPCGCRGSLEFVHQQCMQRWIKLSQVHACGVCRTQFSIVAKQRPICNWQSMHLNRKERARAIFCSVFLLIGLCGFLYSFEGIVSCTVTFVGRDTASQQATLWTFVVRLVFYCFGLLFYSYTLYFYGARNWELFIKWKHFNRDVVVGSYKRVKPNQIFETNTVAMVHLPVQTQTIV